MDAFMHDESIRGVICFICACIVYYCLDKVVIKPWLEKHVSGEIRTLLELVIGLVLIFGIATICVVSR